MNNNLYQNKYRISSTRANWHNYNSGTYFVTICTKEREHYFGEIVDGNGRDDVHIVSTTNGHHERRDDVHIVSTEPTMVLSEIGQYADEQFRNVQEHYPYAEIPLWVVMPNHIHAVVILEDKKGSRNDDQNVVGTMCTNGVETTRAGGVETMCAGGVEGVSKVTFWHTLIFYVVMWCGF